MEKKKKYSEKKKPLKLLGSAVSLISLMGSNSVSIRLLTACERKVQTPNTSMPD